ncbi:MAG: hypothetical protein J0H64_06150 [Actinobacteria bacterium]|nr:hypothetical protein [Actinomycetota bacterium]
MMRRSRAGGPNAAPSSPPHRHGRRPIRSSLTGPSLPDPEGRITRFEVDARSALEVLQQQLGDQLLGVRIGFATAPAGAISGTASTGTGESEHPLFYAIDRRERTITLYRMPIQRAGGLHVPDAEHRTLFVGRCVYLAVCEYLGRDPWELLPGYFDHY